MTAFIFIPLLQMRDTQKVSVWPVALVGGVLVERPLVGPNGQVTGWLVGWKPDRPFALDMAGFAVNLSLLLRKTEAEFSIDAPRGFQETKFLEKLVTREELEPKADMCRKVNIVILEIVFYYTHNFFYIFAYSTT